MSGILDSKTRVIDTVITDEGRRQILQGGLQVKYVSFNDIGISYEEDIVSGSVDPAGKIYLEASKLPWDMIVFEADDSGKITTALNGVMSQNSTLINNGNIVQTENISGSIVSTILSGSEFASTAGDIISITTNSVQKMQQLGYDDNQYDDINIDLIPNAYSFKKDLQLQNAYDQLNIDVMDTMITDGKLRGKINFQFLPPINSTDGKVIGKYTDVRSYVSQQKANLYQDGGKYMKASLFQELKNLDDNGMKKTFAIEKVSRTNNIALQIYEIENDTITKLDMISLVDDDNQYFGGRSVYSIGKVFQNSLEQDVFVNIFNLVI